MLLGQIADFPLATSAANFGKSIADAMLEVFDGLITDRLTSDRDVSVLLRLMRSSTLEGYEPPTISLKTFVDPFTICGLRQPV